MFILVIFLICFYFSCHSLAYLSVCFCDNISEAGIELLGQAQHLISLDITGCKCGDVVCRNMSGDDDRVIAVIQKLYYLAILWYE